VTNAPLRLMVTDDHPIFRQGLRALIEAEADMVVVAEASTGEEGLAAFKRERPDVSLVDLRLPGTMSGVDLIRAMRLIAPDAKALVLTSYDGDEHVHRALAAGARGYLLKGTFQEGLLGAIRAVATGSLLVPEPVAARLVERAEREPLTPREVRVLELVAHGRNNREIGAELGLSEGTVKNHLKVIFHKLGVDDRTHAVILAARRGIIQIL
jgi:DNA-binding NarL/FixJ family response regulator